MSGFEAQMAEFQLLDATKSLAHGGESSAVGCVVLAIAERAQRQRRLLAKSAAYESCRAEEEEARESAEFWCRRSDRQLAQ